MALAYVRSHGPRSSRRLDADEERSLFEQWSTRRSASARAELIESSLWIVALLARGYRCTTSDRADLIAEGHVALLTAFERFDHARGVRFASYARHWISAAMSAYLLRTTNALGSLPRARMQAKRRREARRSSSSTELSDHQRSWDVRDVSLDAPLTGDTPATLHDRLAAESIDAETAIESSRRKAIVSAAVEEARSTFDVRERVIFDERFDFDDDHEGGTLEDIARKLELSRERVRQLEERVRRKLADRLRVALNGAVPT